MFFAHLASGVCRLFPSSIFAKMEVTSCMLWYFPNKSALSIYFTIKLCQISLFRLPCVVFIKGFLGIDHVKALRKIAVKLQVSDFLMFYFIAGYYMNMLPILPGYPLRIETELHESLRVRVICIRNPTGLIICQASFFFFSKHIS